MRTPLVILLCIGTLGCSRQTTSNSISAPQSSQDAAPDLTPAAQKYLQSVIDSGRLAELHYPQFADYSAAAKQFYALNSGQLTWTLAGKPTPQAQQLIAVLETADRKGLDPNDYDGDRWSARLSTLSALSTQSEAALVNFDVDLTVSALRYISDLHLGRVDPKTLHKDFDLERNKYNLADFLHQRVISSRNVSESLQVIEPAFPGYQRTLVALQKYLQLAKEEVADPLPTVTRPIEPGQNYEGFAKLASRLKFLGDLPLDASVPPDSRSYQGPIVDAVKRFQRRHGLEPAGKLGPQTIVELNRPQSFRVRQLQLTLERWRWLPHNFEEAPIVVNIPEFVLRAFDPKGNPALRIRVVVGRAMRTETPVLEEDMKYLVFWPYWNVPPSILRNEIVPKITKDPAYIQKNSYEVVTFSGQLVTDGLVSEEVLAQLRAGKLMVRQKPGPKNALGLIKFIFPNSNNVYLHSTPSTSLFAQSRRDFSHGCIRVEDPAALAEWVLRNNPGWTREKIDDAFKAQKEQRVNLTRTIPVLIVYGTAIVPESGIAEFLPDIYGMDKSLEKSIAESYSARK
jgi:murein L,D-transpeptidase YcbB/YkuD